MVGTVSGRSCADGSLPADWAAWPEFVSWPESAVARSISGGRSASREAVGRLGSGSCCGTSPAAAAGESAGRVSTDGEAASVDGDSADADPVDTGSTGSELVGSESAAGESVGCKPLDRESDTDDAAAVVIADEEPDVEDSDAGDSTVRRV